MKTRFGMMATSPVGTFFRSSTAVSETSFLALHPSWKVALNGRKASQKRYVLPRSD